MGADTPTNRNRRARPSTPRGSRSSPTPWSRRPASTPMLHRLCVAPIVEDGVIRGVITESKSGREAILASASSTRRAMPTSRFGPVRRPQDPKEEMLAASVMFSMTGVNKRQFIEEVKADPQTYRDWAGNAEWDIETTGKEDELFSPFLRKPFKQAVGGWRDAAEPHHARRDVGHGHRPGRPDVPQPRPPQGHRRTDADELTRGEIEGRRRRCTRSRRCAVHAGLRGREAAQLRDDTRGPRHPQDRRPVQHDRDDVREQGPIRGLDRDLSRVHRWLRGPHPADDRSILPGALPGPRARRASGTSSSPAGASAATRSPTRRCAT